jgi:hypothetical protein
MTQLPQTGGSYRRDSQGGITPATDERAAPVEETETPQTAGRTGTEKTRKS